MIWYFSAAFIEILKSLRTIAFASIMLVASSAQAVLVVDMNFDGPTGLENPGIGPDGVLKGGASIVGGQLVLDGSNAPEPAGAGLDLDLGALQTFSGTNDFLLEFDFASIGGSIGALFAADGALFNPNPDEQAGSLNVYSEGDQVVADLWFIGAVEVPGTFNDNQFHHVSVNYNSAVRELSMEVDGVAGDPIELDEDQFVFRDTSHDITRLGDENNPDFGSEFNNGFKGRFDNLTIDSPPPPPVKLVVDRLTGSLSIEVIDPVTIDSISIRSGAGTLATINFDEIDANNPLFDPNDTWQIDVVVDTEISESDGPDGANDGASLTAGQTFALGTNVWRPFFDEDLEIVVNDTVLGQERTGITQFINGASEIFGDLDLDDEIDVEDYLLFQNGFDEDVIGSTYYNAYFLGDLNGDETHNFEDFIAFAAAFDEANGSGAFDAMVAGVPEPSTWALMGFGLCALLSVRTWSRISGFAWMPLLMMGLALFSGTSVHSAELIEYLFDTNFNDTSGNNRHGVPDIGFLGGTPTVSGGRLNLTGDVEEGLIVPLGTANPFAGLTDYTIEMTFSSMGAAIPETGVILFGSADENDPTSGDNQSLSIYVDPQADGGSLVVDYFFVGEVRVDGAELLDGNDHTIKVTYVAPDSPGPDLDPNPGTMYVSVDGEWLGVDQIAPRLPTIADHDVRIGGTLNSDFPFDCDEGVCNTGELSGTVDNFRIFNEEMAPSLLRAEVDLATGEITLVGGEFARGIRYYEITSAAGALNPAGWNSLEEQSVDDIGAGTGEHWDELTATNSQLAESYLLGSSVFDESREISLGNAYALGGSQDLQIVAVTGDLTDIPLEILYLNAPGLDGDYDDSGLVSQGDLDLVLLNWGDAVPPTPGGWINQVPTDGLVSQNELDRVLLNWGDSAGGGSLTSGPVPEPRSALLMVIGGMCAPLAVAARRLRKSS